MKFTVGDRVVVYYDADEDVEVHEPGVVERVWDSSIGPHYDVRADSNGGFIRCFEDQLEPEGGQGDSLNRDDYKALYEHEKERREKAEQDARAAGEDSEWYYWAWRNEQGQPKGASSITREEAREIVNALTKVFGL